MALITCPHCGKNVSDSLETCIHCGGSLKEKPAPAPEEAREFFALPLDEQQKLKVEFEQKFPQVAQSDRDAKRLNQNKIYIFLIILFTLIALAGFVVFLCTVFIKAWVTAGIGAGCFVVGIVVDLIFYRVGCKVDIDQKRNIKRFQIWLKDEKNIHYSLIMSEADRKIYDRINID